MIYFIVAIILISGVSFLIWSKGKEFGEFKIESKTEKERNAITTKAFKAWSKMDASFADKRKSVRDWVRKHVQGS